MPFKGGGPSTDAKRGGVGDLPISVGCCVGGCKLDNIQPGQLGVVLLQTWGVRVGGLSFGNQVAKISMSSVGVFCWLIKI